jgi:beta-glucosidase
MESSLRFFRRGRRRADQARPLTTVVAVVALIGIIAFTWGVSAVAGDEPSYLNPNRSVEDRVNDLLERMTLAEKVGQMVQIEVTQVTDTSNSCASQSGFNEPNPVCMQRILIDNHAGSLLAGGTDIPPDTTHSGGPGNTGKDWANEYNTIQQFAIRNSRLHIPVIFGVDAVHGFGHPFQAPLFPHSIGMGATWDPSAAEAGGVVTARALAATGWVWNFTPVQDLHRDNRWGRTYETWAEEPVLSAALGGANVRGLQSNGNSKALKVTGTVKHFAGYSESINGHDRVEAQLSLRYLQDQFLPSYAGGIDAGAGTVMVDSGSINGVPATASHFLLTEELRNRLGFKGVVISDYGDVPALASAYHIAPDLPDGLPAAIAKAVNAGVDVSMEPFNADQWQAAILQDVQSGRISRERIDQSVRRILSLKFRLGLFDQPCASDASKPCVDAGAADAAVTAGRDKTLLAAQESITLLQNQNNVLPLNPANAKVFVTGPSADSMTNQLGGWSVSWQGVFGAGHVCCMGPANQIPPGTTVLQGIKAAVSSPGQVVNDAGSADAIVVAVGEKAYAEGLGDNPSPALPAEQKALISNMVATGKPVIVVVIAGRPLGLGPDAEQKASLLMAYQGSTEAGAAVADVIFGKVNPSGHLPVSWPSDAPALGADFCGTCLSPLGDQPKFFDQLPDTGSGPGHNYNPLFPFGYGLSYTGFQTSGLSATASTSRNGTITASFTVTNTGKMAGSAIVPVYVHQPVSGVTVPPQRLVGFARVSNLGAGGSKLVKVSFPVSTLAVTPGDIESSARPQVEAGSYQVVIDDNTLKPYDVHLTAPFTIA